MSNPTVMYDDVTLGLLPSGPFAYAGYVNGTFENFAALKQRFPGAVLLDIAVSANTNATCLDVENGDATIAQIFSWFKAQLARGVFRPVIYTSAGNLGHLHATMQANGFARGTYRVWSAHYGSGMHICGPTTCGFTVGGGSADGTQWTDVALGRSLDESLLLPNFFDGKPKPQGATQPTVVTASARWTNATIRWAGARGVDHYEVYLAGAGGKVLDKVELPTSAAEYTFRHLSMKSTYQLGVFAAPSTVQPHWVTVTTK